ncbi:MAG: membrane protein insertion efficiency factor YidD [Victivallales bacterium]
MREEIQQVSREKEPGEKAPVGIVPVVESTNITRISDYDTSTEDCRTEAAGSRAAVGKTSPGSGIVKTVLNCLNPKHAFIAAVKLYRVCVSPWFPPCCRFEPTCSAYVQDALTEHGLLKGVYLSFLRIIRCHPFCRGGYDPVPPKKAAGVSKLSKIRG